MGKVTAIKQATEEQADAHEALGLKQILHTENWIEACVITQFPERLQMEADKILDQESKKAVANFLAEAFAKRFADDLVIKGFIE